MKQSKIRSNKNTYIFLSLFTIVMVIVIGSLFHTFIHVELHPLDKNHLVVGSATALLSLVLITTLFMRTRILTQEVKEKEFELRNVYKHNSIFRLLSEKSSDMIHLNDSDGRILYVNPITLDLLGYAKDEMINKPAEYFIYPEDRNKIDKDMGQVAQGIDIPPREIRLLKKSGDLLDVEVKGFFLNTESDKKYIGAVLRDISSRKQKKHLQEIKKEWEKTFNSMNDFISVHDKDFKVIKANSALCDLLGKTPEEIVGRHCYKLFHNTDEPHLDCPHKKSSETGNTEVEIINDPNIGFPLDLTCSPIVDDSGNFQGSVHIARIHKTQPNEKTEEMIPICSACKKIRSIDKEWVAPEDFFVKRYGFNFTHTVCDECAELLYPEYIKF